jgi:hypothetical protein
MLDDLFRTVDEIQNPDRTDEIVRRFSEFAGRTMFREVREAAPDGGKWYEPPYRRGGRTIFHGRPSIRLHGITLSQGWNDPEVKIRSGKGASITISSRAPHVEVLLAGSPAHGQADDGSWMSWYRPPTSPVLSPAHNHPGFAPILIGRRAARQSIPEITRQLINMGRVILFRPLEKIFDRSE